jgi:hypothetical protein
MIGGIRDIDLIEFKLLSLVVCVRFSLLLPATTTIAVVVNALLFLVVDCIVRMLNMTFSRHCYLVSHQHATDQ